METNKRFAVYYNYFLGRSIHFSVSCNRRIFVDVIVYIISDKHTTSVIEAVAVYTNNFKSLKKLIKLSNLCTCSSSEAMLKDVSAMKNCKIAL